jgi:predicted glycosyltransferase
MRLWIDVDNSPHVLLFAPIIRELQRKVMQPIVTVRDFSQARAPADKDGLEFTVIGRHCHSSSLVRKGTRTLQRAWAVRRFIAQHRWRRFVTAPGLWP